MQKKLNSIIVWIISLVILLAVFYFMGIENMMFVLQKTKLEYVVLFIIISLIATFIRLGKWFIVLKENYTISDIALIFFSSKAVGNITPARLGELAPLSLKKYRTKQIAGLVITDRVIETFSLLIIGIMSFIFLSFNDTNVIYLSVISFFIFGILFILLFKTKLWSRIENKTNKSRRFFTLIRKTSEGVQFLKKKTISMFFLTFTALLIQLFALKFLYLSLGTDISIEVLSISVLAGALAIIASITPGGLGISDAAGAYILTIYNIPLGAIGGAIIIGRTVSISINGLFFLIVTYLTKKCIK
jgi:uncharacterized protein (TIRG00374 family)